MTGPDSATDNASPSRSNCTRAAGGACLGPIFVAATAARSWQQDDATMSRMPGRDDLTPASSRLKLTYDDFVLFPDDGQRHELIDGEHVVSPSPNAKHQRVLFNLTLVLG